MLLIIDDDIAVQTSLVLLLRKEGLRRRQWGRRARPWRPCAPRRPS
jgi:FixJ family two-component response regulator